MKAVSVKKLVFAALFAALICVSTISIRIPTPGTGGYIHPGDAAVILAGVFLDRQRPFWQQGSAPVWQICQADILSMCRLHFLSRGLWHGAPDWCTEGRSLREKAEK